MYRTFTDAPIAFFGVPTTAGCVLANDIDLTYRPMPLPLMWTRHAFRVGVIESVRRDSDPLVASGYLFNTPTADAAATQLAHNLIRPAVDLGGIKWVLTDKAGNELTEELARDMQQEEQVLYTFTAAKLIGVTLTSNPAFSGTRLVLDDELAVRP